MRRLISFFLLMFFLTSLGAHADPHSTYDEGVRLYRENDMPAAISMWESLLRSNTVSGPLLYNLGNAYYRQGEIGKAILFYDRAIRRMPRDADVRENLELARMAVVDEIESPVRLVIWNWVDSVRDYLSLRELATLLQFVGLLAVIVLLVVRFGPAGVRRWAKIAATIAVAVFLIAGSWYGWRASLDGREYAIILVDKTDVRSAPNEASQQIFSLHEGTKVRCRERLGAWVHIQLSDGRKGWMPVVDAEVI
ncbi:tetratricopeptide repeat protein [bacterium]|nr:tetratricopeptide repeat protein [bacterium]MBU1983924.1 tetratricopeptide repeat protein [bacterium]